MTGIYKITNQINGKVYIGQAIDIQKRWERHKSVYNKPNSHEYDYHIYRGFRTYGLDNFKFEVIEECTESELNEREIYWISYYNSYRDGYNETEGGNYARHPMKITPDMLDEIDELLKSNINIQQIADKFGVSYEMIQGINTGRHWHRDNIKYPIGNYIIGLKNSGFKKDGLNVIKTQKRVNHCIDCGKEISNDATRCIECGYKHSRKVEWPDALSLLRLVSELPMVQVGKRYGVSDNTVRKWCDYYGIPKNKKDAIRYIQDNNIIFEDC